MRTSSEEWLEKLKLFGIEPHLTIPEIVLQYILTPKTFLKTT